MPTIALPRRRRDRPAADTPSRIEHGSSPARRQRLAARVPRLIALSALCIVCLVGIKHLIQGAPPQIVKTAPAAGVDDRAAAAFAEQFTRTYLTYRPDRADQRAEALAAFPSSGLSDDFGYTPARKQTVLWTAVSQQHRSSIEHASTFTVSAGLSDGSTVNLSVPVGRDRKRLLFVAAYPSLVAGPARADQPDAPTLETVEDPAIAGVLERAVTNFLAGAENNLSADLAAGALIWAPKDRPLTVTSVDSQEWLDAARTRALVTVSAVDQDGASYQLSYEVGVVVADRPYVNSIGTSSVED